MRPALSLKNSGTNQLNLKGFAESEFRMKEFPTDSDPINVLNSGKIMSKAWARSLPADAHLAQSLSFMHCVMDSFWQQAHLMILPRPKLPQLITQVSSQLDEAVIAVAVAIGKAAGRLEIIKASYELGNIYTSLLPESTRSSKGIFYTPCGINKAINRLN